MKLFARYRQRPAWWLALNCALTALIALTIRHFAHSDSLTLLSTNSFEVVDWLMQESLDVLVTKLGIGACFNTDVQKEFEHDFAPGETVRVPFPAEFLIRNGLAYTAQAIQKRHTTVSCTDIFGIDFEWDSFEQALRLDRGKDELKRNYIDSPMIQLAQEIENRAANWARLNTGTVVGTLGTDPTTFDATSAAARQQLVNLGCPEAGDRAIFVNPGIMRALKNSNISYFNPVSDISKMMRTGIVGYGDGMDWHESVSLYQHTAGTWASTVSVTSAPANGANTLAVTCTAGDTFKQGDKVSIASVNPTNPRTRRKVGSSAKSWCVAQDLTATGSGDVITLTQPFYGPGSPYQNCDALPAASAALTLWPGTTSPNGKTGTVNLVLHRNAFALVNVAFDNPEEGGNVKIARTLKDEETGISISFLRMFDGYYRKWINRFDVCLGFGNLYSDNCAVAIAGA